MHWSPKCSKASASLRRSDHNADLVAAFLSCLLARLPTCSLACQLADLLVYLPQVLPHICFQHMLACNAASVVKLKTPCSCVNRMASYLTCLKPAVYLIKQTCHTQSGPLLTSVSSDNTVSSSAGHCSPEQCCDANLRQVCLSYRMCMPS